MNDSMIDIGSFANSKKKISYGKLPQKEDNIKKSCLEPLKGAFYTILAVFGFCSGNIVLKKSKLLTPTDNLAVFYFICLIVFPIIAYFKKEPFFARKGQRVQISLRAILLNASLILFYFGFTILHPSNVSAIGSTSIIFLAVLSRIFLKEKLGFQHLFAIVLSINGVMFISKPSFIFSHFLKEPILSDSINLSNQSYSNGSLDENKFTENLPLGCLVILITAILFSFTSMLTKKSCNENIHWVVINIFPAYFGLPSCVALSIFLKYSFIYKDAEMNVILVQIGLSSLSAICKIAGSIWISIAFEYEESTKVAIILKFDLILYFVLQAIFLGVQIDMLSVIGSFSIILGTFSILGHNIYKLIFQNEDSEGKKDLEKN